MLETHTRDTSLPLGEAVAQTSWRESSQRVPLCVDVDGTLLSTDLLAESIAVLLTRKPLMLLALPIWLLGGRAALKRRIGQYVTITPSLLPYNQKLLEWIKLEKALGRSVVLASASDRETVQGIADHLGLFDEVLGSDGHENLKGSTKLKHLQRRFGANFDYAGNSRADLPIWTECRYAVIVDAKARVLKRARRRARVVRVFERNSSTLKSLLDSLRMHQWVKNLLIFVPLITSHQLEIKSLFWNACLSFFAFSLCASGVYVLNDLIDLEADRRHHTKRYRPFASGRLSPAFGFALAPLLIAAGLLISSLLPPASLVVTLLYVALALGYSLFLKQFLLLDVFALAALYTIRLVAGKAAYGVNLSSWLLSFSMFLFLSLGFCKRASELHNLRQQHCELAPGRMYQTSDFEQVNIFGVASGFLASLVLTLYMESKNVRGLYKQPQLLWLLFPLTLHWITRIWMLAHRGQMNEDPVLFAIKDKATWATVCCALVLMFLATRLWVTY